MTKSFAALSWFPLPGLAFAQAAADPTAPAPVVHGAVYSVALFLLAHLLPIVFSLVSLTLLPLAVGWLAAQRKIAASTGKSTVLLDIAEKVAHVAQLAVASSDAKILVGDLATRAEKGELTAADAAALKTEAMNTAKSFLSPDGLKQLAAALATPSDPAPPAVVDAYISAHIENAVDIKNNTATAAQAGGSPAPAVAAPP